MGRNNERKNTKGLDIQQIYDHGSQQGQLIADSKLLLLLVHVLLQRLPSD
jgi:hypothetical protein